MVGAALGITAAPVPAPRAAEVGRHAVCSCTPGLPVVSREL